MAGLVNGSVEQAGLIPDRIEKLRERAATWVDGKRIQSQVLLVARHGVICLHEAYGPLTVEPDAPPLRPDSVFWVSSNTKPVTATAAMLLVEDGLLGLSRPVKHYVGELSGNGSHEILVRHLLTHTSGYAENAPAVAFAAQVAAGKELPPCPPDQHHRTHAKLNACYGLDVVKTPGTQMTYDNHHYALLGEVVRRASGQSLWDFAHERIFLPLGMLDTSYRLQEKYRGRAVVRDPAASFLEPIPGDEVDILTVADEPNGGSGLATTAKDYAIFLQMILNGGKYDDTRILTEASVREMTRNQIPGVGTEMGGSWHPEASWGLGFGVLGTERWRGFHGSLAPEGTLSHGGIGGTCFWIDREHEVIGVYFSVCLDIDPERGEHAWDFDLFQDLVTAAIA